MNSYHEYVRRIADGLRAARDIPLGEAAFPAKTGSGADAPVAIVFSPHPDDECVMGGLPVRLARESGFRVVSVPVTLGSRGERRAERKRELANACRYLGFELESLSDDGLERITAEGREREPENWENSVARMTELLTEYGPAVVIFPHDDDGHPTHIGTSLLVADSLRRMPDDFSCLAVETEYWRPMGTPNLMLELDAQTVGDLVTALSFHKGEVRRNPFHLTLPAWLIDNVRRGSETVGAPGAAGSDFVFAALYKVSMFSCGKFVPAFEEGRFVSADERAGTALAILSD